MKSYFRSVRENNAEWVLWAQGFAFVRSQARGSVTSDDIREECAKECYWPEAPNAFGVVFKGKGWRAIGFKQSTASSNHARLIRIWRYEEPWK